MILQSYGSQWCRLMSKMLFTISILQVFLIGTPILADEKPPHGIESVLYDIYQDWNTDNRPRAKRTVAQYHAQMVGADRVVVILEPISESDDSYGLAAKIDRQGLQEVQAEILAVSRSLMRVSIPVVNLVALSQVSGVRFVRTPMRPIRHAVVSEGVQTMKAHLWHNQNIKGQGVSLAILDSGFQKLLAAQQSGELPSGLQVEYPGGYHTSDDEHGTGCAEIVHDVAPETRLHLYFSNDLLDFENSIDRAIHNNIDIISYSGGFVSWGDGKGQVCDIANRAYNNGILLVDSAGNYAESTIHGYFTDSDGDGLHDFGDFSIVPLEDVDVGDDISVYLLWDDFPFTSEDYDLLLYRSTGLSTTASHVTSDRTVERNSRPLASIEYSNYLSSARYHVAIKKSTTARSMRFRLISANHRFYSKYVTPSSSFLSPSDAEGVVSVGAIRSSRYIYGPQEDYSSQGPTMDGRIKPDIMGPTGVKTYAYDSQDFHGTSAAAPHVAGATALILSVNPKLTVSELRNKLFEATVDMGSPGKDNIYGHGRLDLSQIDITLSVFHAGDFDGDLDVDILDLLAFSEVYGLTSSDPNYDARMDMDNNGVIDILDLLLFAEVYGKMY